MRGALCLEGAADDGVDAMPHDSEPLGADQDAHVRFSPTM